MEHDLFKLRVLRSPQTVPFRQQLRCDGQTVREPAPAEQGYSGILREIRRAVRGPWVMFLVVANVVIFLPVGFFPALLGRRPRWWKALATGLIASGTIETIQYFIGRSADVDDVLLNTAGALLGFWLFWLARALCPRLIAGFQCHECHERGDDNGLSHGN